MDEGWPASSDADALPDRHHQDPHVDRLSAMNDPTSTPGAHQHPESSSDASNAGVTMDIYEEQSSICSPALPEDDTPIATFQSQYTFSTDIPAQLEDDVGLPSPKESQDSLLPQDASAPPASTSLPLPHEILDPPTESQTEHLDRTVASRNESLASEDPQAGILLLSTDLQNSGPTEATAEVTRPLAEQETVEISQTHTGSGMFDVSEESSAAEYEALHRANSNAQITGPSMFGKAQDYTYEPLTDVIGGLVGGDDWLAEEGHPHETHEETRTHTHGGSTPDVRGDYLDDSYQYNATDNLKNPTNDLSFGSSQGPDIYGTTQEHNSPLSTQLESAGTDATVELDHKTGSNSKVLHEHFQHEDVHAEPTEEIDCGLEIEDSFAQLSTPYHSENTQMQGGDATRFAFNTSDEDLKWSMEETNEIADPFAAATASDDVLDAPNLNQILHGGGSQMELSTHGSAKQALPDTSDTLGTSPVTQNQLDTSAVDEDDYFGNRPATQGAPFEPLTDDDNFFSNGDVQHELVANDVLGGDGSMDEHQETMAGQADDIGDSWAKALGSPDKGLDDAWGALLADDLDDGFLEDTPTVPDTSASTASIASVPAPPVLPPAGPFSSTNSAQVYNGSYGAATAAAYALTSTLQHAPPERQPTSEPMNFFEELPTTRPVRTSKLKPQPYGPSGPPAPAPPMGSAMPPRISSTSNGFMPQASFRAPEPLPLFPPQPEGRPTAPAPPTTVPHSYASAQNAVPLANPRYSPAPIQPTSAPSLPGPSARAIPSRYNPAPTHSIPAQSVPLPALAPTSNPYAPVMPPAPGATPGTVQLRHVPSTASTAPPALNPFSADLRPTGPLRVNSRYSPAPSGQPTSRPLPPGPAPSGVGIPSMQASVPPTNNASRDYGLQVKAVPSTANPFVPRTSSPLAQAQQRPQFERGTTMPNVRPNAAPDLIHQRHRSIGAIEEVQEDGSDSPTLASSYDSGPSPISYIGPRRSEDQRIPPRANGDTVAQVAKRPKRLSDRATSYAPNYTPSTVPAVTPSRPRTSSPTIARSFSAFSQIPADRTSSLQLPYRDTNALLSSTAHEAFDYVLPTDETAIDPLQRWRGYPIFRWGSGGTVVTSIPKYIPRYSGGQAAPKLKCTPGEIKMQKSKDLFPGQDSLLSFPGPLKSKGKKKDVLTWLDAQLTQLERAVNTVPGDVTSSIVDHTRLGDQLLLWRIMRIMVEHDGTLHGTPAVDAVVRQVLLLEQEVTAEVAHNTTISNDFAATSLHTGNPDAIVEIRQHLLNGNRDKAVWHAVDNKLWGHAMLIASTADNKLWKQVVQEFVAKQVRGPATGNQSLAALYEVFAGNWDESMDQLVPVSARSGFQMVSTAAQSGQSVNQLQGLDKWRETVALILGNRSKGDEQAILSLGKLLATYGRVEAAHVCYIFARSVAHFGGADDTSTLFTVLGADLSPGGTNTGHDLDTVMLSEVYEFALSLPASSTSYYIPHLQAYKLHHACALAEAGMRTEAMQYCEAIAGAIKSTTRVSPYYHNVLTSQVDDLTKRLSQSPKDGTSSLFSKPSIGKVSGNVGKWLGKFIEGDDNENASNGSGSTSEAEAGPFGRLTGGTPTISRTNSMTNMQSYELQQPGMGGSRYAPSAYNSDPAQDGSRNFSNPYAPQSYMSSSEPTQKQERYSTTDAGQSAYGTSPNGLAYTRQPSSLSRYQSNENPVKPTPSPPYESQHPTLPQNMYPNLVSGSPPRAEIYKVPSRGPSRAPSRNSAYAPSPLGTAEALSAIGETHQDGTTETLYGSVIPQPYGYPPAFDEPRKSSYSPSPAGYAPRTPELFSPGNEVSPTSHRATQDYGAPNYEPTIIAYQPQAPDGNVPLEHGEQPADERRESYGFGYQPSGYAIPASVYAAPQAEPEPEASIYESSQGGDQVSAGGYAPPTDDYTGGYQPYVPDTPAVDDDEAEDKAKKPKKKSMLEDDDDDLTTRKASLKDTSRAQRDRDVDDAVRRAAEADAERDRPSSSDKKGWFGGWFGGKKDPGMPGPVEPKVYKAKLGEESSFFFDPETKKWVNRKAPADGSITATSPAATPPPPRAGPPMGGPSISGPPTDAGIGLGIGSRTASPAMPPFSSQPAVGSTASLTPSAGVGGVPPPGSNMPLPGSAPPSAPPSRPTTALTGVSDIDDLLGGPPSAGGRMAGGSKRGKRGGRYVDVMAKKE